MRVGEHTDMLLEEQQDMRATMQLGYALSADEKQVHTPHHWRGPPPSRADLNHFAWLGLFTRVIFSLTTWYIALEPCFIMLRAAFSSGWFFM